MKQISAKFNSFVGNANILTNDIEKVTLRFILGFFGALALLYILFLGNMVKNIEERRSLEVNARVLSNEVGNLELTYLSMSNDVDLNFSYSIGFKETKAVFATRKSLGLQSGDSGSVKTAPNDL